MPTIAFDNTYSRLPERFYERIRPTPVATPRLVKLNARLARHLGLDADWLASADGVAMLAGNAIAEGSTPIAQAYAGHQFGGFNPQLGDGRANLLGEVVTADGRRWDIQLKGSGPTRFSRRGDGRAALGPVLREYIVAEAMAALGVPTTRALAAVATGETVLRHDGPQPGAVLTRVAASHIRVGTFQYFAVRGDQDGLRELTRYVIDRHYGQVAAVLPSEQPLALLEAVCRRQAELIAHWLSIGFVHGVMNTDNMAISGETIDYGPCAFLDTYDPAAVWSSIDAHGRYAYGNQPRIAQWNLARFAETLLPQIAEDESAAIAGAKAAIDSFAGTFETAWTGRFRAKLGLVNVEIGDHQLISDLLERMAEGAADFTLTFRRLADAAVDPGADALVREGFAEPALYDVWAPAWRARLAAEGRAGREVQDAMRAVNPGFIPRNHLVEDALAAASIRGDLAPFERLVAVLARPFDDQPDADMFARPPAVEQIVRHTFCGT